MRSSTALSTSARARLLLDPPTAPLLSTLATAFGNGVRELIAVFSVELLKPAALDLTPSCTERARAGVLLTEQLI